MTWKINSQSCGHTVSPHDDGCMQALSLHPSLPMGGIARHVKVQLQTAQGFLSPPGHRCAPTAKPSILGDQSSAWATLLQPGHSQNETITCIIYSLETKHNLRCEKLLPRWAYSDHKSERQVAVKLSAVLPLPPLKTQHMLYQSKLSKSIRTFTHTYLCLCISALKAIPSLQLVVKLWMLTLG